MSAVADAAADYLRLRNQLGHELAEHHRLLPRFVAFLDNAGIQTVTVAAAIAWANAPEVDPTGTMASRRMSIARGFARHMAGLDSRTEIPPFGVIGSRRHRHEPYIFSSTDIDALLRGAQGLRTRFACATHHSMIGLLAATGMRVGEVIRLDRTDLCPTDGRLLIRESKFGKSRIVPLHPRCSKRCSATPGCATTSTLGRRRRASSSPSEATGWSIPPFKRYSETSATERESGPMHHRAPGFTTCDIPSPSAP